MTTDRLYLVAGSLGERLNKALPELATPLEIDLDSERECVHATVVIGNGAGFSLYFQVENKAITSTLQQYGEGTGAPTKLLTITEFMSDSTWAQFACDYITSEATHFIAMNAFSVRNKPTLNDLVKSQAESEQTGYSLA
jgi:hypothetical protein